MTSNVPDLGSNPPIVTTSNTLAKVDPPTSDPTQTVSPVDNTTVKTSTTALASEDDNALPPPPTTGSGSGMPLDVMSALESAKTKVTAIIPSVVDTVLGVEDPASMAPASSVAAPSTETFDQAHAQSQPPALPARPEEDPKVQALKVMFSDFDTTILQSVLDSVYGDQDRAIDVLLGMNDPSYVSQAVHNPETDLDEQLARELTLQDEDARAFAAEQRLQSQGGIAFAPVQQPSWQPTGGRHAVGAAWGHNGAVATDPANAAAAGSGPDTMTEIKEEFNKIAEAGKKTFSSLFSKVKTKIAEFEQGQTAGYNKYQQDPSHPLYRAPETEAVPAQPVQTQPGRNPPPKSYFDANFNGAGPSGTTHQGDTPQIPVGSPGYVGPANPPSAATPALSTITASPITSPPVGSPGPDPSKIGMLPKRPVSLVHDSTNPTPATKPQTKAEDDDDLGYM